MDDPYNTGYDSGANTGYDSGTNTANNAVIIAGGAAAEPPAPPQPNIPTYGYELSQLMKRYGAAAPTPPRTTDQQLLDKYFAPIQSAKMYDNPKGNELYNAYLDIAQGRMAAPANPMNKFFPGQLVCEAGYRYDPVTATCVKVSTNSPNIGGNTVSTGSPNIGGNTVSTGSPNIGGNQCPPGFNFDPVTRSCVPTAVTNLPALEIPPPKDKPKGPGMTDEQIRSMAGTVTGNAQLFDLYKQDKLSMAQAEKAIGSAPVQHWMQTNTFGGDTVNDRNIQALAASGGGPDALRSLVNSGGANVGDIRRALGDDAVKSWAERYDPALYQKYFGKARGGTFHAPGVPKYAEGDLYRAPPQSMIDFAQQNSSPSLDGLARRYAGAPVAPAPVDPVAAARERYEAASQRLRAAAMAGMQEAPKGPSESEKYFRLASAFLDPGKTGSFGEATGRAAAAMGDYKREQRAADAESAAARRNLATQLAELDLGSAEKNLEMESSAQERMDAEKIRASTPLSAAGRQAADEGFEPGTPEFVARVKEIESKQGSSGSMPASLQELAALENMSPEQQALFWKLKKSTGLVDTQDAAGLTGDDLLQAIPAQFRDIVKAIAEGRLSPSALGARSADRALILSYVNQYNPQWEQGDAPARQKVIQDFTSGPTSKNITSINTSIHHAGSLAELAKAMQNGDIRSVNALINKIKTETGNPNVNNLDLARTAVGDELMKAFRGAGASESEAETWRQKFNAASSPEQLLGAVATAVTLLHGRITEVDNQWKRGMKTDVGYENLLSPEALHVLESIEAPELPLEDQEALEWARDHPNDPDSKLLIEAAYGRF